MQNANGTGLQEHGKLRLLYSSNAPWAHSGYGVQGRSLLPRLAILPQFAKGRKDIAIFAWYGLQSGLHNVEGFRIYPQGMDPYGNDVMGSHTKHFSANIVVSLIDVWVLQEPAKKIAPALFLPWTPIDHDPVPEAVLKALEGAHLPLTYSKWGHKMLTDAGVKNAYIPHGVEPSVYKVLEDQNRVQAFKSSVFGPDTQHLTVMVAANKGFPDRKAFQVQMRAWAAFAKDKPGAKLYIHTEPTRQYGGVDLPALAKNLDIEHRVVFPQRYVNFLGMPDEYMALMYNAADMYLGAAMSEGFGIPLIEAQSCGIPVITTDFSAMPELVRWGMAIAPRDIFWTPMNAWQAWPDHEGIREALEWFYAEWHDGGDMWPIEKRQWVSARIHREYSWDVIVRNQWAPLMERLADEAPPLTKEPESSFVLPWPGADFRLHPEPQSRLDAASATETPALATFDNQPELKDIVSRQLAGERIQ